MSRSAFFKPSAAAIVLSFFAAAAPASAAPVTIAGFTFDDSAFVDTAAFVQGSQVDASKIPGGDFSDWTSIGDDSVVELGFVDNTATNLDGFDILIFEGFSQAENPALGLSLGGATILGTLLGTETLTGVSGPAAGAEINVYGYDLGLLGLGDGADLGGSLFLSPGADRPEIFGVAAVNVAPVPVPASLPLALGAFGLMALLGRRRARRGA